MKIDWSSVSLSGLTGVTPCTTCAEALLLVSRARVPVHCVSVFLPNLPGVSRMKSRDVFFLEKNFKRFYLAAARQILFTRRGGMGATWLTLLRPSLPSVRVQKNNSNKVYWYHHSQRLLIFCYFTLLYLSSFISLQIWYPSNFKFYVFGYNTNIFLSRFSSLTLSILP